MPLPCTGFSPGDVPSPFENHRRLCEIIFSDRTFLTLFESAIVLSLACWVLDVLHSVYGRCGFLLFQFETEFAQHGEGCGEVIEARGRRVAWRPAFTNRRNSNGAPSPDGELSPA